MTNQESNDRKIIKSNTTTFYPQQYLGPQAGMHLYTSSCCVFPPHTGLMFLKDYVHPAGCSGNPVQGTQYSKLNKEVSLTLYDPTTISANASDTFPVLFEKLLPKDIMQAPSLPQNTPFRGLSDNKEYWKDRVKIDFGADGQRAFTPLLWSTDLTGRNPRFLVLLLWDRGPDVGLMLNNLPRPLPTADFPGTMAANSPHLATFDVSGKTITALIPTRLA